MLRLAVVLAACLSEPALADDRRRGPPDETPSGTLPAEPGERPAIPGDRDRGRKDPCPEKEADHPCKGHWRWEQPEGAPPLQRPKPKDGEAKKPKFCPTPEVEPRRAPPGADPQGHWEWEERKEPPQGHEVRFRPGPGHGHDGRGGQGIGWGQGEGGGRGHPPGPPPGAGGRGLRPEEDQGDRGRGGQGRGRRQLGAEKPLGPPVERR